MDSNKLKKDLFSSDLSTKLPYLNEKTTRQDRDLNLYKVDLSLTKDKSVGYKSVIRFLPTIEMDGSLGNLYVQKSMHFIDVQEPKIFRRYFDSPANFGKQCELSTLYRTLKNSSNARLVENSKCIKWKNYYFAYVQIVEDNQRPDLVGQIMVFKYGKQIFDIIKNQESGFINEPCNVFDPANGKDFVLIAKPSALSESIPDFTLSQFKSERSPMSVMKNGKMFKAPAKTYLELASENKIKKTDYPNWDVIKNNYTFDTKVQDIILEYIVEGERCKITDEDGIDRTVGKIDEYKPKELTEAEQDIIREIKRYLSGETSKEDYINYNPYNAAVLTGSTQQKDALSSADFFGEDATQKNANIEKADDPMDKPFVEKKDNDNPFGDDDDVFGDIDI